MSMYSTNIKIEGVPCGVVMRGPKNGEYLAVFEREFASLEDIEAIPWKRPEIQGECVLPSGYGFEAKEITYNSALRTYTVRLEVGNQYLGDVTGYVAQVSDLEGQMAEKDATIAQQAAEIQAQQETIQNQQETIQALETASIALKAQTMDSTDLTEEAEK